MEIPENKVHLGHRERMREKFIRHGREVFLTYELLEMLLYYSIPYRDTNPVSKNLLMRFSSLDGVLSAEPSELKEVSGVGDKTAEFITAVSRLTPETVNESIAKRRAVFDEYSSVGAYFVDYFKDKKDTECVIAHLKSNMELIRLEKISDGDFSSPEVSLSEFIDSVIASRTSAVVIAHNHPYSTHFPSEEDFSKNKVLASALSAIGVRVAEHYIVTGDRFVGFMHSLPSAYRDVENDNVPTEKDGCGEDIISDMLSVFGERGEVAAAHLCERFSGIREISEADFEDISDALGRDMQTALYIKLAFAIASRRYTDAFRFCEFHSDTEIKKYLISLFFGVSVETVYALSIDSDGRVVSSDKICEGTVNSSAVMPRKILESARKYGARKMIIAHNHPDGEALASDEDRASMNAISELLNISGVELYKGYVIGDGKVFEF